MIHKETPLTYEQFEGKVYQYVGDPLSWAKWMQEGNAKNGMYFLAVDLKPFVSGAHPQHNDFRDSIKAVWDKIDTIQRAIGKIAVGSVIHENQPRVGVYVSSDEYGVAQSILEDIA
jgi:hypothetical protein